MPNVIFTNAEQYAQVHEGFRLDNLNQLAAEQGVQIFATVLDDGNYPEYSNVTYTTYDDFDTDWSAFYAKHKPNKVINFIDYLTPIEKLNIDCDFVYFVRSCYAEVLERNPRQVKKDYWLEREQTGIESATQIVTDSPTSQAAIQKHYGVNADLMLEYVNPQKYLEMPAPTQFAKKAHFTGRFDSQKRFDLIDQVADWDIIGIGSHILDTERFANIETHQMQNFESYKDLITDSVFGLYPAIWESNGYGVQQCLAMGKVPIIQTGSGGHERLCNGNNSISIDWTSKNWWEAAEEMYSTDMHEAAKNSLTQAMYQESLEKFIEVLHS